MKLTSLTKEKLKQWRNGADGFFQFCKDMLPCIPQSDGRYTPIEFQQFQIDFIKKALSIDENGNFNYSTLLFSFPRRHSKTILCALLVIWRFCTRQGELIVCLANSRTQSASVSFGLVRRIILNSPELRELIGTQNVFNEKILFEPFNNSIVSLPANESALYGMKISCGWCSELHAALSDDAMQVLASSLGDTQNSWMLIDSTCDEVGGTMHRLEELSKREDKTICACVLRYANLKDALKKLPPWLSEKWLRSREKQLLPQTFSTQHLNQRCDSDSALFSKANIELCKEKLPMPMTMDDLKLYANGRNFVCGGGLDRSYGFGLSGKDATVWSSVAKIGNESGEAEYVLLNQTEIFGGLAYNLKKAIMRDFKEYCLFNTVLESYNAADIATWAIEQGIPCEVIHPTNQAKQPAFLEIHRIVKENRLKFSDKLTKLPQEMGTFLYEVVKGQPRFGSDKFHDDTVFSLAWAVHSLRQKELCAYELDGVFCDTQSTHKNLCYVHGGDLILNCTSSCVSHLKIQSMYNQYRSSNVESEITLPQFYNRLVKVSGISIVR